MKRKRSDSVTDVANYPSTKRHRATRLHLLDFTDEVILRILSFLEVSDLNSAERVSRRFQRLSTDDTLWKAKYFRRWVQQRARRSAPSRQKSKTLLESYLKSSKLSIVSQDAGKINGTDWKRLYRIRSNWWLGRCKKREMKLARPMSHSSLCGMQHGIVFTVDEEHGLRSWSRSSSMQPLKGQILPTTQERHFPSALAVTAKGMDQSRLFLGYSDGSLDAFSYSNYLGFTHLYRHAPSLEGAISSLAAADSYLLAVSHGRSFIMYQEVLSQETNDCGRLLQLAALRAEITFTLMSLSLRDMGKFLIASIVFPLNGLESGWCVGVQEIRLSKPDPGLECSVPASDFDLTFATQYPPLQTRMAVSQQFALHPKIMHCPTALSYTHPYLVATLADNTLIVYLVTSNAEKLEIQTGRRLWGHTSAIANVQVDARGRAVTVSMKGDDLRVWELEDLKGTTSPGSTRIRPTQDLDPITAAIVKRGNGLELAVRTPEEEALMENCWIGFDRDQVVLARERKRQQILICYDFDFT